MKIGLLPFFIELYDLKTDCFRPGLEPYYEEVAKRFEAEGIEVIRNEFCRIKPEFDKAVAKFEADGADAIVTIHMAYSPSLESIEALCKTKLPIVVLDSTITPEYCHETNDVFINYNHGIHGVMDMCSMLKRYGKPYAIAAGHMNLSDVLKKVCALLKAAKVATSLSGSKTARIGGAFHGMGDFIVSNDEMKERFGIEVDDLDKDLIKAELKAVTNEEIDLEIKDNALKYDFLDGINESEYRDYVKSCLAMRKIIDKGGFSAFTMNFLNISVLGTMPFLEACKAMERGVGYAG